MIKKIFWVMGILLGVLIFILLFNTLTLQKWPVKTMAGTLAPLPDSASTHLSQAIQLATISISDSSEIDTSAFIAFDSFLVKAYPLLHTQLSKMRINRFSYVFEWTGQNNSLLPIILMGHYDVVPVEKSAISLWSVEPFSGKITDTCIWGRGAVDDKSGVISILEAVESMLQQGFTPQRTIWLCFGHDEEVSGRGAKAIVQYLEQKEVIAEMVLDEGGEITEEKIKDVKRPIAAIGVAEKGYVTFELTVQKEGGHSSKPDKETAIDILSTALHQLRRQSTTARITPPVKEFLGRIGSSSENFINRLAAANMWLLEGTVKKLLSEKPEGYAMIHTTIVPTILKSGTKDNVIPTNASAIVNCRILPGENAEAVLQQIKKMINDDRVGIVKIGNFNSDPSPATDITSPALKRIESAIYKTIPGVIPAPYLMIGATDSRYYRKISKGVVNFLPMTDSKGYHGINERLPIISLQRSIHFMKTIISESNLEFK